MAEVITLFRISSSTRKIEVKAGGCVSIYRLGADRMIITEVRIRVSTVEDANRLELFKPGQGYGFDGPGDHLGVPTVSVSEFFKSHASKYGTVEQIEPLLTDENVKKDFMEWSGGFEAWECSPKRIDTYMESAAPWHWDRDDLDGLLTAWFQSKN